MSQGSAHHDDFATEAMPGLPEHLPVGETLLWQGAPEWRALAWRALHIREVALYFGVLGAWRVLELGLAGAGLARIIQSLAVLAMAGLIASAILGFIAWRAARSTMYTITSRRLVMRIGIVLPMTFNFPFAVVARADAELRKSGSGNVSIGLKPGQKIAWPVLWPHVRPWRLRAPEPTLREINDAAAVAGILADALRAACGQETAHSATASAKPDAATEAASQHVSATGGTGSVRGARSGARAGLATAAAAAEH